MQSKPETTPELETWHRQTMEVSWTDSGKLILRHGLKKGGRISFAIEIDLRLAQSMKEHIDA